MSAVLGVQVSPRDGTRTIIDLVLEWVLRMTHAGTRGCAIGLGLQKEERKGVLGEQAENIPGLPGMRKTRKKLPRDTGIVIVELEKGQEALRWFEVHLRGGFNGSQSHEGTPR